MHDMCKHSSRALHVGVRWAGVRWVGRSQTCRASGVGGPQGGGAKRRRARGRVAEVPCRRCPFGCLWLRPRCLLRMFTARVSCKEDAPLFSLQREKANIYRAQVI